MITIAELEEKDPTEIVKYKLPTTHIDAFADESETLTAGTPVVFAVYETTDTALATDLVGTMVRAVDYDTENSTPQWVAVEIQAGTNGKQYYAFGGITTTAGRKYVVVGRFKVRKAIGT